MLVRQSGAIARIAFFLCGVLSILLGKAYWSLQFSRIVPGPWRLFSAVMIAAGGFGIVVALLPSQWRQSEWKFGQDSSRRLPIPLRILASFAAASFLMTAGLTFAPLSWHPSAQLVFAACPACVLSITVDPSPISALLILAPLSAAVYGSFGGALGYIFVALRRRVGSARY
jgi:hypothetical protein